MSTLRTLARRAFSSYHGRSGASSYYQCANSCCSRRFFASPFCTEGGSSPPADAPAADAAPASVPDAPPREAPFRFDKPVSLVNGASRGLGLAMTRRLLEKHPDSPVVATCRSPEGATDLAALKEEFSSRLSILRLDVTEEDSIKVVAKEIADKFGRLDLCLTSVGVLHIPDVLEPEAKLINVKPENMMLCYRVNAVGPIIVAKHMLPLLKVGQGEGSGRGGAVVANMTCKVGSMRDNHLAGWYSYRASKASLNQFTRTLGIECKRRKEPVISVVIHPGVVDTELSKPYRRGMPPEKLFSPDKAAELVLDIVDTLKPEDSAKFFCFNRQEIPW